MELTGAPLATLMALAAWFLGLSLFVQVAQELYKQLTSSRSRAYSTVLMDFAGPFAKQLLLPHVAADLSVRGPFQFRRLRPQGRLQPLDRRSLVDALERTQPTWYRLTRQALEFEARLQREHRLEQPSPAFDEFLKTLDAGQDQSPGHFDAAEMVHFLDEHGGISVRKERRRETPFNPARLLSEFRRRYSPEIVKVDEHFDQLMSNFDYAYRRRNLRQTFVIALALALWFDFSFDSVVARAAVTTPAQASAISYLPHERVLNFGQRIREAYGSGLLTLTATAVQSLPGITHYVFGCVITAILICFGAPFWNDLTKSLPRMQGKDRKETKEAEPR